MQLDLTGDARALRAADRTRNDDESSLEIEIDDQIGLIRVNDARLFHPTRRALARRLLVALCEHPGVRKAEVDLDSSSCRVDFDLVSSSPALMATVFADAVGRVSTRAIRPQWWARRPRWSTLTAYRASGEISVWETQATASGRRLLHEGRTRDRAASSQLADNVASLNGVERCQVSLWSRRITVFCDPAVAESTSRLLDRVERILEARVADPHTCPDFLSEAETRPVVATGLTRLTYIALAGGAFSLTLVGLIVPGVPTVPFLLATSYYLARSSPALNERLRRTVFFGPILREWEGHASLSLTSKGKLVALTATIVVVTVMLAPLTPLVLGGILVVSSASIYGITRIPALGSESEPSITIPIGVARTLPV